MHRFDVGLRGVRAGIGLGIALLVAGCPAAGTGGAGGATTSGADSSGPIMVGEFGSLTGKEATFGTSTDDGVQLAVQEINDAGGIKGRKLQVKVEDDQSLSSEAATAVQKLIDRDRVVAIIGEVASGRSLAGAPI